MFTLKKRCKSLTFAITAQVIGLITTPAIASQNIDMTNLFTTPTVDPWTLCGAQTTAIEQQKNIPKNLLTAISLAEAGRWNPDTKANIAWPWTVTYDGKGRFFDSKQEAQAEVEIALTDGVRNVDVGCMQINLKYHPDAFASLSDAFDPATNTAYAANFLKSIQAKNKNWALATGVYHSSTKDKALKYRRRVFKLMRDVKTAYGLKSSGQAKSTGRKTYLVDRGRTEKLSAAFKARKQKLRARNSAAPNSKKDTLENQRQAQLSAWRKSLAEKKLRGSLSPGGGLKYLLAMRRAEQATAKQKKLTQLGNTNSKAVIAARRRDDLNKWRSRYNIAKVSNDTAPETVTE